MAASASDAFHLVIPSMPGFGFSGKPKDTGWNPDRIARAWAELMKRLGYTRYVAQGGDWGSPVSSAMARQAPAGLLGIHINLPATVPSDVAMALAAGGPAPAGLSEKERAAFDSLDTFFKKYRAYGAIMGTRPQAIGYGLADSPVGLAAWIFDYNNGEPARRLNRDDVLDNITLYWLTNTATSAARIYWETAGQSVMSRRRRRPPRSRSRSPSPCFPTRSIEPRRPGRGAPIATSSTSTRSTRAATSPPGSSLSSSLRRSAPRSGRSGNPDHQFRHHIEKEVLHMKTKSIIAAAALDPRRAAWRRTLRIRIRSEATHGATQGETVTVAADKPIPNLPGKRLVSLIVDYAPGGALPRTVTPTRLSSTPTSSPAQIRSQVDNEPARVYRAGEAWFENPGAHHRVSANASKTKPARLLAVFIVDAADEQLVSPDTH